MRAVGEAGLAALWARCKEEFEAKGGGGSGGSVAAYVADTGTSNGWTWRKWSDGTAECWGFFHYTLSITAAWQSLYESTVGMRKAYPFTFAAIPVETATLVGASGTMMENYGSQSATQSGLYYAIRPDSRSGVECYLNIHVIGRWK